MSFEGGISGLLLEIYLKQWVCFFCSVAITRRVYVSNLSWGTSWQMLKDHMRPVGHVVHVEILQRHASGRSVGSALVEYDLEVDAQRAVTEMDGSVLDSRTIFVRKDRERKPMRQKGTVYATRTITDVNMTGLQRTDKGTERQNEEEAGRTIAVFNLPFSIEWHELKNLFLPYGTVVRVDILKTKKGTSRGIGTVTFTSDQAARDAIQATHGSKVKKRIIEVRLDRYSNPREKKRNESTLTYIY